MQPIVEKNATESETFSEKTEIYEKNYTETNLWADKKLNEIE